MGWLEWLSFKLSFYVKGNLIKCDLKNLQSMLDYGGYKKCMSPESFKDFVGNLRTPMNLKSDLLSNTWFLSEFLIAILWWFLSLNLENDFQILAFASN
jgi:hypothetical protein